MSRHLTPFRSFIAGWRNNIRKFSAEIFQNAKKSAAAMWQILRIVITGRIAAKRQPAGIKFTHRPKIRFFAGATRCTDSGQTLQGRRARGSAWLCKISPQSLQGVGMRPKMTKISTFGKKGDSLDRFLKFSGAFIQTMLH